MTFQEFQQNVVTWAANRNLLRESMPEFQTIKLAEELGELCAGVARDNRALIKDSIGDCMVVVTILRAMLGATDPLDTTSYNPPLPYDDFASRRTAVLIAIRRMGQVAEGVFLCESRKDTLATITAFYEELDALCSAFHIDMNECCELAWNEIKDRKGLVVDGVFMKQADIEKKLAELDARLNELVDLDDDDISLEASELATEAALWQDRLVACMK